MVRDWIVAFGLAASAWVAGLWVVHGMTRQVADGDEVIFNLGAVEPFVFAIGLADGSSPNTVKNNMENATVAKVALAGDSPRSLRGLGEK